MRPATAATAVVVVTPRLDRNSVHTYNKQEASVFEGSSILCCPQEDVFFLTPKNDDGDAACSRTPRRSMIARCDQHLDMVLSTCPLGLSRTWQTHQAFERLEAFDRVIWDASNAAHIGRHRHHQRLSPTTKEALIGVISRVRNDAKKASHVRRCRVIAPHAFPRTCARFCVVTQRKSRTQNKRNDGLLVPPAAQDRTCTGNTSDPPASIYIRGNAAYIQGPIVRSKGSE